MEVSQTAMEPDRQVEEQISRLLQGQGAEVTEMDLVPEQARPAVLRKTVSYIVCAVVFNHKVNRTKWYGAAPEMGRLWSGAKEEVLLVQESKQECYQQWYLPAGRMEEGESIQEALRREVKEEAGFDCQPITLLLVQEQGPQWIRFVFLAKVTGGQLKAPDQADQESLQASWWDRRSPLPLRGRDILPLIDAGLKYQREPGHPSSLPVDLPCSHVVQRLVLIFCSPDQNIWVLLVKNPWPHPPCVAAVKTHSVMWACSLLVKEATPSSYYDHALPTLGLLAVQHAAARPPAPCTDGVCLNVLVAMVADRAQRDEHGEQVERAETGLPPHVENARYRWHHVQDPRLRQVLLDRMKNPTLLPLHSLY